MPLTITQKSIMLDNNFNIMGVLNVTPDSFFDGGEYTNVEPAVQQALEMESVGAKIIDIGGESTRPGALEVTLAQELDRVLPIIEAIRKQSNVLISIDTSKPGVMKAAVEAGANIINDVRALSEPGSMEVAVSLDVPVCLMHMRGQPRTMQSAPQYLDVVDEVLAYLIEKADECSARGIKKEHIWIDPGFGFGKTLDHNLFLLKHLDRFVDTGFPVLVGMSRKSMLGAMLDVPVEQRLAGSLALATIASLKGAAIIRVHDVEETVHVAKVCHAFKIVE